MIVTCQTCEHQHDVDFDGTLDELVQSSVLICSECGTRKSFGEVMPRVVISAESPHWVTMQIAGGEVFRLDAQYAAMIAKNLLSVAV